MGDIYGAPGTPEDIRAALVDKKSKGVLGTDEVDPRWLMKSGVQKVPIANYAGWAGSLQSSSQGSVSDDSVPAEDVQAGEDKDLLRRIKKFARQPAPGCLDFPEEKK